MRRARFWITLPLLVTFFPGVATAERYAFLVGVQQYQGTDLRALKYAEKDIEDLATVLTKVGYKPANIVVLTESRGARRAEDRPDAATIRRRLALLLEKMAADDVLLSAFSGHGVQFKEHNESYFCPAGADLARLETLLPLDRLYKDLAANRVGMKVLLVDACRSDPQVGRSPTTQAESITRPPDPPGGISLLFSCSPSQQSFEDDELEHGVFFHYVIEALRGKADFNTEDGVRDGNVTLPELESYVVGQVPNFTRDHLQREQVPNCRGDTRGVVSLAVLNTGPVQAPPIARAPFDLDEARRRQQQWAAYLGTPVLQTNTIGMELVLIPPGKFQMGSGSSAEEVAKRFEREEARLLQRDPLQHEKGGLHAELAQRAAVTFERESPQHEKDIPEPFYLGKYEVTVRQFRAFVQESGHQTEAERDGNGLGWNPQTRRVEKSSSLTWASAGFPQGDSHPVVLISWNDANAFCQWLSRKTGARYRLPTEAEWEYACRAGTTTLYSNGADSETTVSQVANLADSSSGLTYAMDWDDSFSRTAPVGSFTANAFGLHDMHGNVYEWCSDLYAPYGTSSTAGILQHTTRGGSWESVPEMARSSLRQPRRATWCCDATGFRVVLLPRARPHSVRDAAAR